MYFFYFDESGTRDPSVGIAAAAKYHIYVLLAVGMYERQWFPFDPAITKVKLELIERLYHNGGKRFELADCLDGLKVWPEGSPLVEKREQPGRRTKSKTLRLRRVNGVGLGFPYRAHKGHLERLLDSDEAASLLKIHPKTLQRMARRGQVTAIHVGKLWRFRASALNEWLETKTATRMAS